MSFPKTKPIPKSHHDILTNRPTGHICTIRPDGRPTVNPVALMFDGEYVRVSTVKTRMKYKNLVCLVHSAQQSVGGVSEVALRIRGLRPPRLPVDPCGRRALERPPAD